MSISAPADTPPHATPTTADDPLADPAITAAGLRVELRREGQVAVISLDRPDVLNAQTPATWAALGLIRDGLPGSVRIVVLRGEGRAFSAGLDRRLFTADGNDGAETIADLGRIPEPEALARIKGYQAAFGWLQERDLTSVALVQGHAIGGGFQLALACDLRLVAADVSFCMAEPGLGIVPDLGGTQRLVDVVGYSRAVDLCLTVRRVGADEALQIGLATAVVPTGELDAAVEPLLDALLAVPRDAAAATKALLRAANGEHHSAQEQRERTAQVARLRAMLGG